MFVNLISLFCDFLSFLTDSPCSSLLWVICWILVGLNEWTVPSYLILSNPQKGLDSLSDITDLILFSFFHVTVWNSLHWVCLKLGLGLTGSGFTPWKDFGDIKRELLLQYYWSNVSTFELIKQIKSKMHDVDLTKTFHSSLFPIVCAGPHGSWWSLVKRWGTLSLIIHHRATQRHTGQTTMNTHT